ncbi:MAG TPA: hypothetical protein VK155_04120 [Bacteroidales bacterium]|jgi:hypothetical protein|nr:hypothetical protein [Bacteroidales bacterium]
MEQMYFPLGSNDDNRFVKIIRILFGFACIAMAVYWGLFNMRSDEARKAMWATIIFMLGFGLYQVWAGLGKTSRFIIIGNDFIRMKQHSLIHPQTFHSDDLSKIEIHPLSIIFFFKRGKKTILRLGAINYETNEDIANSIASFCESSNIPYEVKEEKIF